MLKEKRKKKAGGGGEVGESYSNNRSWEREKKKDLFLFASKYAGFVQEQHPRVKQYYSLLA